MNRHDRINKRENCLKLASLIVISLVIAVFMTELVAALSLGGIGGSIGGFFEGYAAAEGPTFLDFFIFAVIFIALCWAAFSSVFKDAKNASVVLAVAVGLALSIALVYGGKFTIKKLLPFAGIILFLLIFVGIYAVLKKFIFTKDTIFSRILSAVVAIIVSIALLAVAWNMICSDNNCESNVFLRKVLGSESVVGRLFAGMDITFSGGGPPQRPLHPQAIAHCGNGRIDPQYNEECDPADREGAEGGPVGCEEGQVCDNCRRCLQDSAVVNTAKAVGSQWVWILLIIAFLLLSGLSVWKRKNINKWYKTRRERRRRKKELRVLKDLLVDIQSDENSMLNSFRKLCEAVKNEKATFDESRHIVDSIKNDIKETIGEEREFIEQAQVGETGNISHHIDRLLHFNNTENHLVTHHEDGIIPTIDSQLSRIGKVPRELKEAINELENVEEHFQRYAEILQTFKQHDFKERNIISNIISKLEDNRRQFESFAQRCAGMTQILNQMHGEVHQIVADRNIDYPTIMKHIRGVRDESVKLNQLFTQKVSLIHYLVNSLDELKKDIGQLHAEERSQARTFVDSAVNEMEAGKLDKAIYFATLSLENATQLRTMHLEDEDAAALEDMIGKAKDVIRRSLPGLFDSLKPEIEEELMKGEYDKVMRTAENSKSFDFLREKYSDEFGASLDDYEAELEELKRLCGSLRQVGSEEGDLRGFMDITRENG